MRTFVSTYVGITYPKIFCIKFMLKLWKRFMCKNKKHLFDEVWSIWGQEDDPQHYLSCDACGLAVFIKRIVKGL